MSELVLFSEAYKRGNYRYYHLISGMDLPLHNQDFIHAFFEKADGYEFFAFTGDEINNREKPERRIQYYYRYQDSRAQGFGRKLLVKMQDKLLVPMQKRRGVNRLENYNGIVRYGSNWVSVTDDFAGYMLERKAMIEEMFRDSFCGDEVYKHLLLLNSPFKDRLFITEGVRDRREDRQGNLRYINWWTGSPRIWRMEDREELIEASNRGFLFSRKFDERVDGEIIDFVVDRVTSEKFEGLYGEFL